MSLLDGIASAIGHTPETLAQAAGTSVGMLEKVISGLSEEGIDVFSSASRLGLTPDGLLRGIVTTMKGGDSHQQFLSYLQAPVKPMSDPLASLTSQWLHMMDLHQNTAQAIDRHIQDLFQGNGTESYSGPAADTLWNTHQDYQRYFNTIVDHAQTQHTRHKTLSGHVDDYVSQMPGKVNSLSIPVAAFAVLSIQMKATVSPLLIDPAPLEQGEQEFQQVAGGDPEPDTRAILEILVGILYLLILIIGLINTIASAIGSHNSQQNNTRFNPPPNLKPTPAPTPGPTNRLSPDQEKLAERLYNDYKGTGLTLDDIRDIIEKNPNLTESQLRALLNQYTNVIKDNPNLVKKYGALAVFEEFIALAAYDPAAGGNYALKKPISVRKDIQDGISEAETEMGAMEQGKVPWPLKPSQNTNYDAESPDGTKWDTKSLHSVDSTGKPYNAADTVSKLQKDFSKGEKVILDDRDATQKEIDDTYDELKKMNQENDVVWWPNDPSQLKPPPLSTPTPIPTPTPTP